MASPVPKDTDGHRGTVGGGNNRIWLITEVSYSATLSLPVTKYRIPREAIHAWTCVRQPLQKDYLDKSKEVRDRIRSRGVQVMLHNVLSDVGKMLLYMRV